MLLEKLPHKYKGQAGFTLVEVLVVLVIIGLIMGLAAQTVFKKSDSANIDAANIQIKSFKQALELFELDVKRFPTTDEGLKALVSRDAVEEEDAELWKGPYIRSGEIVKDPWNKDYVYQLNEDEDGGKPYYLYTPGVTGKPETKVGILPPTE